MNRKLNSYIIVMVLIFLSGQNGSFSAGKEIQLLKPDRTGGIPVMAAINKRESSRSFAAKNISDQVLSNLLWAACGINRSDSGKRTAPSAMNKQEIDIFAAMDNGLYKYNAVRHSLELVSSKDIRSLTGLQNFVKDAPLTMIYVADMSKVAGETQDDKLIYAGADTGFIGENVYLYCASEGLAVVIRAYIDKGALGKAMNLKENQMIILAQTVGYPGSKTDCFITDSSFP